MQTSERRAAILKTIKETNNPISASALAKKYGVSRQIIVGDVALLRASQHQIIATPRGYVIENNSKDNLYTIASIHNSEETKHELEIIIDCGGKIRDVIISHPIYGQISGRLDIESRLDIENFMKKVASTHAKNLSEISGGVHFHTIECKNENALEIIKQKLSEAGYLYK